MLNFIGRGAAFNPKEGNNAAYYKKGDHLFLIDCGSNVYTRLIENNVLDGVNRIYVLITHTHPDHIGSLGDLIFHSFYSLGEIGYRDLRVIAHPNHNIPDILQSLGITENMYYYSPIRMNELGKQPTMAPFFMVGHGETNFLNIRYWVEVPHVKELYCVGYILEIEGTIVYYSGDSNNIPEIILEKLLNDEIDIFYQDTCGADYEGNVHLSLMKLYQLIPHEYRNKVYCMHLDKAFDEESAKELGFNVVNSIIADNA